MQFFITFPYPLRYWLNTNKELFGGIHHIITTETQTHYNNPTAIPKDKDPKTGIVSLPQRWGSALNLNPHLHIIAIDGMNHRQEDPVLRKAKRTKNSHISTLLSRITSATLELIQQRGYLYTKDEIVDKPL